MGPEGESLVMKLHDENCKHAQFHRLNVVSAQAQLLFWIAYNMYILENKIIFET